MFDLISIGDSAIDTFIPLLEAEIKVDHGQKMICLPFGSKVPVEESMFTVAGNAANNAVGAARLGLNTAIYTNVGDNPDDHRIKNKLKQEGVNTRYVVANKGLASNNHIVLDYKGERTILVYHQPWKFDLPDLEKTKWVYLTSMSPSYLKSNIIEQIINYLERTGARMHFNPGTFQIKNGIKKHPRLLSLTDLFIVNKEEADIVLGLKVRSEGKNGVKKLLKQLQELGPTQVIITDGKNGSYGYDGVNYYQLGVFPAKLVEMTGSGDAYATGVLTALFYGKQLPEAMRWGAANGAAVIEQMGPLAGLLTYNEIQQRLKQNIKIKPKII